QDISSLSGVSDGPLLLSASLADLAPKADVYIDFTSVESSLNYLEEAVKFKLPAVIGTTGFDSAQKEKILKASQTIAVLWAPNMSTGINVMNSIAATMARMLGPDYDIEIVEAHHNQKVDSPSGTALKLHETLSAVRAKTPQETLVTGRSGTCGARTKDEIGVFAVRGGDIVGDHTVYFSGPGERLELTHRAQNRDTFAQGAVRAAVWLASRTREPGLYTLEDTLVTC
ncbi:MAG: 4-hydroxy-tetrahydrodipicolinate reductase, partial [Candidatus Adiutrix sp.]